MDFDAFIADCRAQWRDFNAPQKLAAARNPEDRRLKNLLDEIPGMATENKLFLLNRAVAHLSAGEVYVEVGSYRGASVIGAALGNPGAKLFACDNFSQFDGVGGKPLAHAH